jgi:hypothetical protein
MLATKAAYPSINNGYILINSTSVKTASCIEEQPTSSTDS